MKSIQHNERTNEIGNSNRQDSEIIYLCDKPTQLHLYTKEFASVNSDCPMLSNNRDLIPYKGFDNILKHLCLISEKLLISNAKNHIAGIIELLVTILISRI